MKIAQTKRDSRIPSDSVRVKFKVIKTWKYKILNIFRVLFLYLTTLKSFGILWHFWNNSNWSKWRQKAVLTFDWPLMTTDDLLTLNTLPPTLPPSIFRHFIAEIFRFFVSKRQALNSEDFSNSDSLKFQPLSIHADEQNRESIHYARGKRSKIHFRISNEFWYEFSDFFFVKFWSTKDVRVSWGVIYQILTQVWSILLRMS